MNTQIPAHLQNSRFRQIALEKDIAGDMMKGLGTSLPPHISIKDDKFTLVDAAGNRKSISTVYVDVVIVGASNTKCKMYYEGVYNPNGENAGPSCFSDNAIAPDPNSDKPQHSVCGGCPRDAWGSEISKLSGKKSKQCSDGKKIAVMVPSITGSLVYMLRLPPKSLEPFQRYSATIKGNGMAPSDFVTRLSFDNKAIIMERIDFVSPEIVELLDALDLQKIDALVGKSANAESLRLENSGAANRTQLSTPMQAQLCVPTASSYLDELEPPRDQNLVEGFGISNPPEPKGSMAKSLREALNLSTGSP